MEMAELGYNPLPSNSQAWTCNHYTTQVPTLLGMTSSNENILCRLWKGCRHRRGNALKARECYRDARHCSCLFAFFSPFLLSHLVNKWVILKNVRFSSVYSSLNQLHGETYSSKAEDSIKIENSDKLNLLIQTLHIINCNTKAKESTNKTSLKSSISNIVWKQKKKKFYIKILQNTNFKKQNK